MKTCGGRIYDKERHDEGKATARILSGVGFVKAGLCDGCAPIQSRRGGGGGEWGRGPSLAPRRGAPSPPPPPPPPHPPPPPPPPLPTPTPSHHPRVLSPSH